TEHEADDGVRGRAASLAENPLAARELHDVVHGQEIRLVTQIGDQLEFVLDEPLGFRRDAAGPAPMLAALDERAQMARGRLAPRHELARVLVAQLVEREGAAFEY